MARLIYYEFTQQRASVVAAIQYYILVLNISDDGHDSTLCIEIGLLVR